MFANDGDSDREKIQSTVIDLMAGAMALFLTLNWFKALVQAIRGELKDAAGKPWMTIIESMAKRIAQVVGLRNGWQVSTQHWKGLIDERANSILAHRQDRV